MDTAFIESLDETAGRYLREALEDCVTDTELREHLAQAHRQTAEATQEVADVANPADVLAFAQELDRFLSNAKLKALEARRIEDAIEAKQLEMAEAQGEIKRLSASMPELAVAVNRTLDRYEEARHDYNSQEFQIATLSTRLSMRRGEVAELHRRLAQLKG